MLEECFFEERIVVKTGDITEEGSAAIVNAANKTLLGGGGVDGAIHRKGGEGILRECRQIRRNEYPKGLPTGEAVVTTAGNLVAGFVIHTVGPIYGQENNREADLLASCYENCLLNAEQRGFKSISFPSISTGAFGFPKHLAARIASEKIVSVFMDLKVVRKINLVFFSDSDTRKFLKHCKF